MQQRYALESNSGHIGGVAVIEAANGYAGAGRVLVFLREGIAENALKDVGGSVVGVEGEAAGVAEAQWAQVIHAEDVVGVSVSVEDGVDVAYLLAESLAAEIRASIDHDGLITGVTGPLDGDRRASAGVSGIGRGWDL